jgi:hypothetical protein
MDFVQNIDAKVAAIQTAEAACAAINGYLEKESIGPEVFQMLSELKVDLADIRYEQQVRSETFGQIS